MKDSVKKIIIAVVAVVFVIFGVFIALNVIKGQEEPAVSGNDTELIEPESIAPADSVEESEKENEPTVAPVSVESTKAEADKIDGDEASSPTLNEEEVIASTLVSNEGESTEEDDQPTVSTVAPGPEENAEGTESSTTEAADAGSEEVTVKMDSEEPVEDVE